MRNTFALIIALLAVLASSCSQDELLEKRRLSYIDDTEFFASFETDSILSRTYIEEDAETSKLYLRWTKADEITIFRGNTLNQRYQYKGETGDNSAGFRPIASDDFVSYNDLDNPTNYAVYPYNENTRITEKSVLNVALPANQKYAEKSFGLGANTMVAVTQHTGDVNLLFKNVCGYFKFKFYGEDLTIRSVTLQGNNEENLAGKANVTSGYGSLPAMTMVSDTTKTLTLDCGEEGIKVGSTKETATEFWFVVPPTQFTKGFTITVTDMDGGKFIKTTEKVFEIKRNTVKPISAIEVETVPDYQYAIEREALIAIYNALDGDNWTNNENWCSDKPINEWYGIQTEQNMVTDIYLPSNGLVGNLPPDIGNLLHLSSMDLTGNNINSLPSTLGDLRKLKTLWLHNTNTKIALPEEIGHIKSLQKISAVLSGTLPETFYDATNLEYVDIYNFQGTIGPKIGNLQNLKYLRLTGHNETSTAIPQEIGNCCSLEILTLNCNLSGNLPETIGNLINLKELDLSGTIDNAYSNKLVGAIPSTIAKCNNLTHLYLQNNQLSGSIPEGLGELLNLKYLLLYNNRMDGVIPNDLLFNTELWDRCWGGILQGNTFRFVKKEFPKCTIKDIDNNQYDFPSYFSNKKLTVFFQFDPYFDTKVNYSNLINVYNKCKNRDVEIFGFAHSYGFNSDEIEKFILEREFPWNNIKRSYNNDFIHNVDEMWLMHTYYPYFNSVMAVDNNGDIVYYDFEKDINFVRLETFIELYMKESYMYISTDYSADSKVTTLQTAKKGDGVDIVLMGDAYSDRQIADGTYRTDMEYIYNNLFTEEPYKSFKDYFNVYYVNVVSATEGYGYNNTTLAGYFGEGTLVGGNDNAVFTYAQKAISTERMDEALIVVAMNSNNYAGTCYMYHPTVTGGYGNGISVSYFPKGENAETFAQLLHHEALGHGFAKLADEYAYESMGAIPATEVITTKEEQTNWGWWKNVDFTSDPSATRWSHFINDTRYANDGLGAYEGGLTYWTGVWRPTENSIMRYNTGGFNAPSREAIYYRIHKLAYGDSWQYDYEEFVKYDAINRKAAASSYNPYRQTNYKPLHAPVVIRKSWKDAQ